MLAPDQDDSLQSLLEQWRQTYTNFDIGVSANIISLVTTLDSSSNALARSVELRPQLGAIPSLWLDVRKLWRDLARAQLTFWDGDDSENEDGGGGKKQQDLRAMCASLAKFTRNLVAGVAANQTRAFENEPDIRRLIHYYTSWSAMEDDDSIPVARILAQALSNMVTTNELLLSKLWDTYMSLPEDQVILIRLLSSPDPRTLLTALIFILNCIHGSKKRAKMLSRTVIGVRVCVCLLDDMLKLYDAEESSEGAQAFDVGYDILTQLIEQGLVSDLYSKFTIRDEVVTPHQTTLLKIIDSYLQSTQMSIGTATAKTIKTHIKLSPMLANAFFALSAYAQKAVERALQPSSISSIDDSCATGPSSNNIENTPNTAQPPPLAELDVMLPKVCEALVLVTQCIVTVTLEADQQQHKRDQEVDTLTSEPSLKDFFNETRSSGLSLVESLIGLLRLLDLFLPRINFGKPVTHSLSAHDTVTPTQQSQAGDTGFQYVKRDLVRLLGILCHGVKAVQDRTRDCGGIEVIMNLCVIDERNPYLREHAIFTLRNLLDNNSDNQAVVNGIKPTGGWDESSVLKDTPGSVRK